MARTRSKIKLVAVHAAKAYGGVEVSLSYC
jgi:hypothetical protein